MQRVTRRANELRRPEPTMTDDSATGREIARLMQLHPAGYDLSLERITRLLERLGNPHENLPPVIHVAGTNGKGSTCAFARAVLEAAGATVHVHTSPHLVSWRERFRLGREGGGVLVDDDELAATLARVGEANGDERVLQAWPQARHNRQCQQNVGEG